MNIYKNFISKDKANQIEKVFLSFDFPWFYSRNQILKSKDSSFMFHCFYRDNKINSNFYYLIEPILNKLNINKIVNIRSNLSLKRQMKNSWHSDFIETSSKSKVAIYYVNTNDGYTEFKNKKIESEKNKIVVFNGDIKHRAVYQKNKDVRMVINFNYESI